MTTLSSPQHAEELQGSFYQINEIALQPVDLWLLPLELFLLSSMIVKTENQSKRTNPESGKTLLVIT